MEVLFIGGLLYDVLLPSFIAGIVGFHVSSALGIRYFHGAVSFVPKFSGHFFLNVCLSGIFFGACSFLLVETLRFFGAQSKAINVWKPLKGLIGGSVLVILSYIFSTRYLGLGLYSIKTAIEGGSVPPEAFF